MTTVALIGVGWLVGAALVCAFIAAANRWPTPEPFLPLDDLEQLARCC